MAATELRAHKGTLLAELYLYDQLLYTAVTAKLAQQRWLQATRKMDAPGKCQAGADGATSLMN